VNNSQGHWSVWARNVVSLLVARKSLLRLS
jgi:hypothetical protein